MPGYLIASYTVLNEEKYGKYREMGMPTLAQYGGKVLISSDNPVVLEGKPAPSIAIIEFESVEAAQRWYDSPEYAKVKHFRHQGGVSEGWIVIVPQFEMPQV